MNPGTRIAALIGAGMATLLVVPSSHAANWTDKSPYYENDAWYDISEWFDGNNYNPTNEAWWRWDSDTYKPTRSDANDDAWYGYTNGPDWFYDYYEPALFYSQDGSPVYEYGARYIDYNNDGTYDAMISYSDTNGDGHFDKFDYHAFGNDKGTNNTGNGSRTNDTSAKAGASATNTVAATQQQEQRLQQQVPTESREQSLTGEIQQMKQVQVRGGKHTVVQMKQDGGLIAVDLGDSTTLQPLNLAKGDQITIKGPRSHVGDKDVILARTLEAKNQTRTIDRARRQMTGTVASVHRTKVHGTEHLFAMVNFPGANAGRAAVDFGPADKAAPIVKEGAQVAFSGVPVQVSNERLLVAQTLRDQNGKMISIAPPNSGRTSNSTSTS